MAHLRSGAIGCLPGSSFKKFSRFGVQVPKQPITIGITLTVLKFQSLCNSIHRFLYLAIFSDSLLTIFASAGIATSIKIPIRQSLFKTSGPTRKPQIQYLQNFSRDSGF